MAKWSAEFAYQDGRKSFFLHRKSNFGRLTSLAHPRADLADARNQTAYLKRYPNGGQAQWRGKARCKAALRPEIRIGINRRRACHTRWKHRRSSRRYDRRKRTKGQWSANHNRRNLYHRR